MMLLGDAGGVYGSFMLIGSALNMLISANEQSTQLLKYYFRVNEPKKARKIKINPVTQFEKGKSLHLSMLQTILHNTLISTFLGCLGRCKCCTK